MKIFSVTAWLELIFKGESERKRDFCFARSWSESTPVRPDEAYGIRNARAPQSTKTGSRKIPFFLKLNYIYRLVFSIIAGNNWLKKPVEIIF